jgi:hypothetical protein
MSSVSFHVRKKLYFKITGKKKQKATTKTISALFNLKYN